MIRKLKIDNLKCIDELNMDCTGLNVLIGTNSSGKSTILQGILFLVQNLSTVQGLNGDLISLGTMKENRCLFTGRKEIEVSVWDEEENAVSIQLYMKDEKIQLHCRANLEDRQHLEKKLDYRTRKVQYLSCHRVGAQNVYEKNMSLLDSIGTDGKYAVAYLNEHAMDLIAMNMCRNQEDFTLLGQVNWWLKYIVGVEISTEEIPGADMVQASYRCSGLEKIRPQNVGAGVSYLLSIIIMCLASAEDSVLIIENPEIHLHPAAQSKVSEFLYFISKNHRQVFVETHSDHIFNGFRAGITTGEMKKEAINMYFVFLNKKSLMETMLVEVGRCGRIENQREDLFDQFELDMNRMIGI